MTTDTTRVLDPVSRATEILFGLIMVLTFTASLNVTEASRADVRLMLIAALGCNLAWGLIDAATGGPGRTFTHLRKGLLPWKWQKI